MTFLSLVYPKDKEEEEGEEGEGGEAGEGKEIVEGDFDDDVHSMDGDDDRGTARGVNRNDDMQLDDIDDD